MFMILLLGCLGFDGVATVRELPAATLKPHVEAFEANRKAFPFWTFRFEMSTGLAADLPAFERNDINVLATAQGFFASDGRNMRYDLVHPVADHQRWTVNVEPSHSQSMIASYRALTDGDRVLEDSLALSRSERKLDHLVGIYPDLRRFYAFFMFPLDLGRERAPADRLTKDFERLSKGDLQLVEYDPAATLGGRKVVRFALAFKQWTRTYWIDPERGSIPLKCENRDENGKVRNSYLYDDIQFVEKIGWLPRRKAIYHDPQLVRTVRITEMRLDRPPDPSEFQLAFDQPIPLMDAISGFRFNAKKEWGLLTLPSPEPGIARKVGSPRFEPKPMIVNATGIPAPVADPLELPGERKPWPSWIVYTLLAVVGITIGAAALGWRMRRLRAA